MGSHWVVSIGAVSFGLVIGYITYRTLARSPASGISDLAAVVAVIGGGTVTALFDPAKSDSFGWYAIGLLGGMVIYGGLYRLVWGKKKFGKIMGDDDVRPR
jgi:hypothetical protein